MSTGTVEAPAEVVVRTEKVAIPTTGMFSVSLLQVNNKRYKNYRTDLREEHALDLMKKIKEHGQLQPCAGSWNEDGSMIDLWGGFSRFEVMQRIALEKLVREYNEAMKLAPDDPNYVSLGGLGFGSQKVRERVRDAGPEWKAKYDAALASYKINFQVMPVENEDDAAIKGVCTNAYDKPPLADLCAQVEALCSRPGITASKVAKEMRESDAQISHYRKINRMPTYMRELFEKADYAKDFGIEKPEDQVIAKGVLMTAVSEFQRRLGLELTDPRVIKFSVARDFGNLIDSKKEELPVAVIAGALKKLVRINQAGHVTELSTPDWNDFKLMVADIKKVGKLDAEQAQAAATAPAAAPAVTLSTLSKEQQEVIDKAAAAVTQVTTPVANPVVQLSAEEKAKQESLKAANADGGTVAVGVPGEAGVNDEAEDVDLDDLVPSADQLLALAGAGDEGVPVPAAAAATTAAATGQLASKPKDAPETSRYKLKAPEKLEKMARDLVKESVGGSENVTVFDQTAYLFGSVQLFDALGMNEEAEKCNEAYANFMEECVVYLAALEQQIKESLVSDAVKAELLAKKPVLKDALAATVANG